MIQLHTYPDIIDKIGIEKLSAAQKEAHEIIKEGSGNFTDFPQLESLMESTPEIKETVDIYLTQVEKLAPEAPAEAKFEITETLRKLMPTHQQRFLKSLDKEGKREYVNTLSELDAQLNSIPDRGENDGTNPLVHAHYFIGDTDIFVLEWDRKENLFYSFTILNGDTQNAEMGWTDITEIITTKTELDFHWRKVPINKAKRDKYPKEFPLKKAAEAPAFFRENGETKKEESEENPISLKSGQPVWFTDGGKVVQGEVRFNYRKDEGGMVDLVYTPAGTHVGKIVKRSFENVYTEKPHEGKPEFPDNEEPEKMRENPIMKEGDKVKLKEFGGDHNVVFKLAEIYYLPGDKEKGIRRYKFTKKGASQVYTEEKLLQAMEEGRVVPVKKDEQRIFVVKPSHGESKKKPASYTKADEAAVNRIFKENEKEIRALVPDEPESFLDEKTNTHFYVRRIAENKFSVEKSGSLTEELTPIIMTLKEHKKEIPAHQHQSAKEKKPGKFENAIPIERETDSVRFIRRFVGLHKKRKHMDQLMSFLDGMQKAMSERRITKDDPHAKEIQHIQRELVKTIKSLERSKSKFTELELTDKELADYGAIAFSQKAMLSISYLKRYISLDGKKGVKEKAKKLVKDMDKAFSSGKVTDADKYFKEMKEAHENLLNYTKGDRATLEIWSAGLNGIMELSGTKRINSKIKITKDEVTTMPSDSKRIYHEVEGTFGNYSFTAKTDNSYKSGYANHGIYNKSVYVLDIWKDNNPQNIVAIYNNKWDYRSKDKKDGSARSAIIKYLDSISTKTTQAKTENVDGIKDVFKKVVDTGKKAYEGAKHLVHKAAPHVKKGVSYISSGVQKVAQKARNLGIKFRIAKLPGKDTTEIESVLFNRSLWQEQGADKWLVEHGYKHGKPDVTANYLMYRQRDPKDFQQKSFRTISAGHKEGMGFIVPMMATAAVTAATSAVVNHALKGVEEKPVTSEPVMGDPNDVFMELGSVKGKDTFMLKSEIGTFLGNMEKGNRLSMTIEGDPGSGKTQFAFQLADAFADEGMNTGIFELESAADSDIVKRGRDMYLKPQNVAKVKIADRLPEGIQTIRKAAATGMFGVIVIDSWGKTNAHSSEFDKLRKDFPGVIWVVIIQRAQNTFIKGGNDPLYDADINIEVVKPDESFVNNYATTSKNRYGQAGLKYNIAYKTIIE